ncbi:hypothetical protein [Olivibacter sp. CPCC 100613]
MYKKIITASRLLRDVVEEDGGDRLAVHAGSPRAKRPGMVA